MAAFCLRTSLTHACQWTKHGYVQGAHTVFSPLPGFSSLPPPPPPPPPLPPFLPPPISIWILKDFFKLTSFINHHNRPWECHCVLSPLQSLSFVSLIFDWLNRTRNVIEPFTVVDRIFEALWKIHCLAFDLQGMASGEYIYKSQLPNVHIRDDLSSPSLYSPRSTLSTHIIWLACIACFVGTLTAVSCSDSVTRMRLSTSLDDLLLTISCMLAWRRSVCLWKLLFLLQSSLSLHLLL